LLVEVLRLDPSVDVATKNLMAAYYNCGVELYNKQHCGEALPLIDKAIEFARKCGSQSQLAAMNSVRSSCARDLDQSSIAKSNNNAPGAYSGNTVMKSRK